MSKYYLYPLLIFGIFLSSCGKKEYEAKPILKDITETVFASGFLEANNTYNPLAQNEGHIVKINFDEGSMVRKGQTLAVLNNKESQINTETANELFLIAEKNNKFNAPLFAQATANIEISKQRMEQDAVQLDRYKRLWENNSISKIEYENTVLNFKSSQTNYTNALENYKKLKSDAEQQVINNRNSKQINAIIQGKNTIQALVNGKVLEMKKELGDFVKKGDIIAVIGDPEFIYAKLNIDESSINKIKLHQEVQVQLNTNKDKTYKAKVFDISPSFDETSQSFVCKARFTDTLDFDIVKTPLQANIVVGTTKNALLIPRNFIDFGSQVSIKGKKGKIKVLTKFVSNQYVQVLSGIQINDILLSDQPILATTSSSQNESDLLKAP